MKSEAGKGSKPRPVQGDKYRANYDRINFRGKKVVNKKRKKKSF